MKVYYASCGLVYGICCRQVSNDLTLQSWVCCHFEKLAGRVLLLNCLLFGWGHIRCEPSKSTRTGKELWLWVGAIVMKSRCLEGREEEKGVRTMEQCSTNHIYCKMRNSITYYWNRWQWYTLREHNHLSGIECDRFQFTPKAAIPLSWTFGVRKQQNTQAYWTKTYLYMYF